jgi:hypothetical protein
MNPAQLDNFRNVLLQELTAATESLRGDSDSKTSEQIFLIPDETDMANLSDNRTIINALTEARLRRLRERHTDKTARCNALGHVLSAMPERTRTC